MTDEDHEPAAERARGDALLAAAGRAIVGGVERLAVGWFVGRVADRFDAAAAAGYVDPASRPAVLAEAEAVAGQSRDRVVAELRALFAENPAAQRMTPLEIVRSLAADATRVLDGAGVPAVARDAAQERAFPDDRYDLVPATLSDLGDDELGPQLLAWGMGKALVLRAER
jgi:hypothetical protein